MSRDYVKLFSLDLLPAYTIDSLFGLLTLPPIAPPHAINLTRGAQRTAQIYFYQIASKLTLLNLIDGNTALSIEMAKKLGLDYATRAERLIFLKNSLMEQAHRAGYQLTNQQARLLGINPDDENYLALFHKQKIYYCEGRPIRRYPPRLPGLMDNSDLYEPH